MAGKALRPWQVWTIVVVGSAAALCAAFWMTRGNRSPVDAQTDAWLEASQKARANGEVAKQRAVAAVKRDLRDPESAQFGDMLACYSNEDPTIAIGAWGSVNAKNGFGGYAGAERFVSINGDVAFMGSGRYSELFKMCGSPPSLAKSS